MDNQVRHVSVNRQNSRKSGNSMSAVDGFFFKPRKRCPEMSEPRCGQYAMDPARVHHKDLYQPLRRTTFY
ncbi:MAG: hypothetical protein ACR2Q3_18205 [Woeseiaceae bacterium]